MLNKQSKIQTSCLTQQVLENKYGYFNSNQELGHPHIIAWILALNL